MFEVDLARCLISNISHKVEELVADHNLNWLNHWPAMLACSLTYNFLSSERFQYLPDKP